MEPSAGPCGFVSSFIQSTNIYQDSDVVQSCGDGSAVTHSLKEEAGDLTDKSRSPDSEYSLCEDGRQEVAGAVHIAHSPGRWDGG